MAEAGDNDPPGMNVGLHLVLPLGVPLHFVDDDENDENNPLGNQHSPLSLVLAALFGGEPSALHDLFARSRKRERLTDKVYECISDDDQDGLKKSLAAGVDSADEDTLEMFVGNQDWQSVLVACRRESGLSQLRYLLKKRGVPPLIFAAALNRLQVLRVLYAMMTAGTWNADPRLVSALTEQVPAAMWWACRHGNVECVSYLLGNAGDYASCATCSVMGSSPLHSALLKVQSGSRAQHYLEIVKFLVGHGADVNAADTSNLNYTPLMMVLRTMCTEHTSEVKRPYIGPARHCVDGDEEEEDEVNREGEKSDSDDTDASCDSSASVFADLLSILLCAGADVKARAEKDITALHLAACCGQPMLVETLVREGADVNALAHQDETPAYSLVTHAATEYGRMRSGDVRIFQCLLAHGADVGICCHKDGCSAFHVAVQSGYWEVALMCVNDCPQMDVTYSGKEGDALLMLLDCVSGCYQRKPLPPACLQLFEILLSRGCNVIGSRLGEEWYGWTPLQLAAASCQPVLVQRLLDSGCTLEAVKVTSRLQASPLHLACHRSKMAALSDIGRRVQDILLSSRTVDYKCPVHDNCLRTVRVLLDHGADLSEVTEDNLTPLHFAAKSGSCEMVSMLLAAGAPTNMVSQNGETLLHTVCAGRDTSPELLKTLVGTGIDVDRATHHEKLNCVQISAILGRTAHLRVLLEAGAEPDYDCLFQPDGRIMRRAKSAMLPELVIALLEKSHRWTALHLAVFLTHVHTVEVLLNAGADPSALAESRGDQGGRPHTALHLAAMRSDRPSAQRQLLQLLCEGGAKLEQVSYNGLRPLHFVYEEQSSAGRRVQLLTILLENGAKADSLDEGAKGQSVLHRALHDHCVAVAELLLSNYNADANCPTHGGSTPLTMLVAEAKSEFVGKKESENYLSCLELLLEHGAATNAVDVGWSSPLHIAASSCLVETVKLLLSAGTHVNEWDSTGCTPLLLVLHDWPFNYATLDREKVAAVCDALIKGGADVNLCVRRHSSEEGMNALHLACWYRLERVVGMCITAGASLSTCAPSGLNLLHLALGQKGPITTSRRAASSNTVDESRYHLNAHDINRFSSILTQLCAVGADCNACDGQGRTILHRCLLEDVFVIPQLIALGADVNAVSEDGSSPLHCAFSQDRPCINRSRLQEADIGLCNELSGMPCDKSIESQRLQHGRCCLASCLLKAGAKPNVVDNVERRTPLHLAMHAGTPRAIAVLLRHGACPNIRDANGETPLMRLMVNLHINPPHDLEVLRLLAEHAPSADLNAVNTDGDSLLHHAVRMQSVDAVEFLIRQGHVKADIANAKGQVPLHLLFESAENRKGMRTNDLAILALLLGLSSAECGLAMVDESGNTPLMLMLSEEDFNPKDYNRYWVQLCPPESMNITNKSGLCALHLALRSKWVSEDLVEMLLMRGARVDQCTPAGNSPLHYAAVLRHAKLVQLLLANGADCSVCNESGATPFEACLLSHHEPVSPAGAGCSLHPSDPFFDLFGITPDPHAPPDQERQAHNRAALKKVFEAMPGVALHDLLTNNNRLQSLLQSCVWMQQADSVQVLLDQGINPMFRANGKFDCPLVLIAGCSCSSDSDRLFRLLLDCPGCSTSDSVDALLLLAARRVQRELAMLAKYDINKMHLEDDSSLLSMLHSAIELRATLDTPTPSPALPVDGILSGHGEICCAEELQDALLDTSRLRLLCHSVLVSSRLLGKYDELTWDLLRCLMSSCAVTSKADSFQATFHLLSGLLMETLVADQSGGDGIPRSLPQRFSVELHTKAFLGHELGCFASSSRLNSDFGLPMALDLMLGLKRRSALLRAPEVKVNKRRVQVSLLFDVAQQAVQLYCNLLKGGQGWVPDLETFVEWMRRVIDIVGPRLSSIEGKHIERTVLWLLQLILSVTNSTEPSQPVYHLIRSTSRALRNVPTLQLKGLGSAPQVGTLLHAACNQRPVGHLLVQLLLRAGLRPNVHLSQSACTPLHLYVRRNSDNEGLVSTDPTTVEQIASTVKLFIECGAHTDAHWEGTTAAEGFLRYDWLDSHGHMPASIRQAIDALNPPVWPLQCLAARVVRRYRRWLPVSDQLTSFLQQFVDLH